MPGTQLVAGGVRDLLAARRRGLSLRDCIVIVGAGGRVTINALFRAPLEKTVIEGCLTDGGGGLHIDACRIQANKGDGRWPTNVVFVHNACTHNGNEWVCSRSCVVRVLDTQSGELTSGTGAVKRDTSAGYQGNAYGKESRPAGTIMLTYGDSGGASRFFPQMESNAEVESWLMLLIGSSRPTPAEM